MNTFDHLKEVSIETLIQCRFQKIIAESSKDEYLNYEEFEIYLKYYFMLKNLTPDLPYSIIKEAMKYLKEYSVTCNIDADEVVLDNGGHVAGLHRRLWNFAKEIEDWLKIYNKHVSDI